MIFFNRKQTKSRKKHSNLSNFARAQRELECGFGDTSEKRFDTPLPLWLLRAQK
ncbi:hypothetical protein Barb6XT_02902 [Bacteroidales bacterium Barb6XT]|nr:hypothetical protein Barb6XT_02902 [Bacteroidales bacterium Barb6XT]